MDEEFTEIITSLTEASNVTFFQKAVDCSMPCLYLATVLVSDLWHCDLDLLLTLI